VWTLSSYKFIYYFTGGGEGGRKGTTRKKTRKEKTGTVHNPIMAVWGERRKKKERVGLSWGRIHKDKYKNLF